MVCSKPASKWVSQFLLASYKRRNVWLLLRKRPNFQRWCTTSWHIARFLLKTSQIIVWHVFTCFLTSFDWFEAIRNSQNFRLFGRKRREKFFAVWKLFLRKCTIPTTIWKHISNISKAQIRREKKVNYPRSWFRIFSRNSSKKVLGVTNIKNKIRADKEHAKILRIWAYHIFSRILTNLCEFLAKRTAQIFFSNLPRFLFKNWRLD